MQCPHCHQENQDGAQFCRVCGKPLGAFDGGAGLIKRALVVIGLLLALLAAAGLWFVFHGNAANPAASGNQSSSAQSTSPVPASTLVKLGVAYGTEKEAWFTWAVQEFAKTPEGSGIHIDLKPMGSIEAANAIVRNDAAIQVWSPASSLYKTILLRNWKAGHADTDPLLKETILASTPMVFVMWQERYDAFVQHYQELNFRTIGQAINEPAGWKTIAEKPDWYFFKFSHTNPSQSNSGLTALVLMGYDHFGKTSGLDAGDITNPDFQTWLQSIEKNLQGAASGLVPSTGTLMTSMIQRGWSTYDCVLVYEANAIERLDQAGGRWGPLRVVYPPYNMWNDNPYYVLNVAWSSPEQRRAADAFGQFLLSPAAQRQAAAHGFRPASQLVGTGDPDSPWVKYTAVGIQRQVPGTFCDPPNPEVMENLLLAWQRSQSAK